MSEPAIRLATPEDAPALLAIYEPYVRQTAITCEYEVPSVEEFAGRIERTLKRYPYLVMELDGRPVGYAYVSPLNSREAYDWSVETSIYLACDVRHGGLGRLHARLRVGHDRCGRHGDSDDAGGADTRRCARTSSPRSWPRPTATAGHKPSKPLSARKQKQATPSWLS